MRCWNSISFQIEASGDLSIAGSEDVDPGHTVDWRYVVSVDDEASVQIHETHVGDDAVRKDRAYAGTPSDVPVPVVMEAHRWLSDALDRARVGSTFRDALEAHLENLRRRRGRVS